MLKHYWTVTWRSLKSERSFTMFSVAGLTTGLTACLLIAWFVHGELAYDRFHEAADRIYRIAHVITINQREIRVPMVPGPMAEYLRTNVSGVEDVTRFVRRKVVGHRGEHRFIEEDVLFADLSFPRLFTMPEIKGRLEDALARPDRVILTEATARKYFGDGPVVGEMLKLGEDAYTVAAVVEDISDRSHLAFDIVVPLENLETGPWIEMWSAHNLYTYAKLAPGLKGESLQRELDRLVDEDLGPRFAESVGKTLEQFRADGGKFGYFLQPLPSIHLHSDLRAELRTNGSYRTVQALIIVGLLILLIACMNYVNLAIARNTDRLREIGLRKALGAHRRELVAQFLFETGVLVLLSAILSLGVAGLLLTSGGWGGDLETLGEALAQPEAWGFLLLALLVLVLLAGGYPALVLASATPGITARRGGNEGKVGRALRAAMVMFQFAAALVLICWSFTIDRQMSYVANKDLGFDPEGVVLIENTQPLGERWRAFKREVERLGGVESVSGTRSVPGRFVVEGYLYPGSSTREEDLVLTRLIEADADFVETLEIPLLAGQSYGRRHAKTRSAILVNEPALRRLGFETAVGQRVTMAKVPSEIVGLIGEMHFKSLHETVEPLVIRPLGGTPSLIAARLAPGPREPVLEAIDEIWSRFLPEQPLDHTFLAAEVASSYDVERGLLRTIQGFALTAILLACLGIYGLAAYSAVRKRRAIGIRRAIGASVAEVVLALSKDVVRWVVAAVLLAAPIALWASRQWLDGFAYRTDLPWWMVPAAALLVVVLALLTVFSRVLRAARTRPADCLTESPQ